MLRLFAQQQILIAGDDFWPAFDFAIVIPIGAASVPLALTLHYDVESKIVVGCCSLYTPSAAAPPPQPALAAVQLPIFHIDVASRMRRRH
jgi:hypothetical protein